MWCCAVQPERWYLGCSTCTTQLHREDRLRSVEVLCTCTSVSCGALLGSVEVEQVVEEVGSVVEDHSEPVEAGTSLESVLQVSEL